MEMAGLFEVHEACSRALLEHLRRKPPPKFDPPGIDAVLRADREMWVRVAEEVGSDFVGPGRSSAVDDAIKKWQHGMQVAYFLVPVAKPEKRDKQPNKRTWETAFTGQKRKRQRQEQVHAAGLAVRQNRQGQGKQRPGQDPGFRPNGTQVTSACVLKP